MAKIVKFSGQGDTLVLDYDPAVEAELATANEIIRSEDGKLATFYDESNGEQVHGATAETILQAPRSGGG